jgi:hypothetical protein
MMWNQNISKNIYKWHISVNFGPKLSRVVHRMDRDVDYPSCELGTNGSQTRGRQIPSQENNNCCRNMN